MIPLLLALAVFHVPVTCDMAPQPPPWDYAVGVYHNTAARPSIQLRPFICDRIDEARHGRASRGAAVALHVLGHELAHSYGIGNETGADCVGGMLLGFAGDRLGVPPATLDRLWELDAGWRDQSCQRWDEDGNPTKARL